MTLLVERGSSLHGCAIDGCLAGVSAGATDGDRLRHNRGSTNLLRAMWNKSMLL